MAYLSTAEFKTMRDISGAGDDVLIGDLIDRAKARIDKYCRRTFEGTASDRKFDSHLDVEGSVLWVYEAGDLASISSITNGNGDSVSSSDYVTEPRNAVAKGIPITGIRLKTNSSVWWRTATGGVTEDAITVNGVWAYSATAPDDIAQATAMLVGYWYDQRKSSGGDLVLIPGVSVRIPRGMPMAVREILNEYVRAV